MSEYEVWLDDDRGRRMRLVQEIQALEYVNGVEQMGWFGITIGGLERQILRRDLMIEVWRKPEGGTLGLEFVGFLRRWRYEGTEMIKLSGPGLQDLLRRRIVAYAAGTAEAEKTDYADDMMKAVVRENLGGDAATARDWSGLGLSVAGDLSLGPSIDKGFAWKNVYETLRGIAETARQAGTEVYFDLVPTFSSGLIAPRFETYIGQPGMDRRVGGTATPALFGLEFGNLEEASLEYDYSEEVTYAYAGGQGLGEFRLVEELEDTARSGGSAWGRIEAFGDARNDSTSAAVEDRAREVLIEGEPSVSFSGKLVDSAGLRYGRDWSVGDRVTVRYQGVDIDGLIRVVQVNLSSEGESIRGSIDE